MHIGVRVYTHTNRDFRYTDGTEIESSGQEYVYNNRHTDVYFEIEKDGHEYGTEHKTRSTRNTDRQTGREENRARGGEAQRAEAAARHLRVGPKKGAENIWGLYRVCLFFFINTGGLSEINPGDLSGDKSPDKAPVS